MEYRFSTFKILYTQFGNRKAVNGKIFEKNENVWESRRDREEKAVDSRELRLGEPGASRPGKSHAEPRRMFAKF